MTEQQTPSPEPATEQTAQPTGNPPQEVNPETGKRRRVAQPATRAPKQTTRKPATAKPASRAPKATPKPAKPTQAKPATPKTATGSADRAAKRELATRMVLAAAKAARTDEERVLIAHWLHHVPADRDRWVTVLPKPDRSDWR